MDANLSTQTGLNTAIQEFALAIEETSDDGWTDGLLMSRFQILDRYWDSFEAAHVMILQSDLPRAHRYFSDRLYARPEEAMLPQEDGSTTPALASIQNQRRAKSACRSTARGDPFTTDSHPHFQRLPGGLGILPGPLHMLDPR